MSVASLLLALFAVLPGRVEAQNNTWNCCSAGSKTYRKGRSGGRFGDDRTRECGGQNDSLRSSRSDEGWRPGLFGRRGPDRCRWPDRHQLHRWHILQSIEQRSDDPERIRVRTEREVQFDFLQTSVRERSLLLRALPRRPGKSKKSILPLATMEIRCLDASRFEISDDGAVKFSTLIEEGKKKPGVPAMPRAGQKVDRKFDFNSLCEVVESQRLDAEHFCRGRYRAALVGNPRRIRQTRTFGVILFATRSIIMGAAPILVALLLTSSATARKAKAANDLQSIEMCNGSGRISIEPRELLAARG